jgi:hypothetical protein
VDSLALRVGMGCMELHDRLMVGTERLELDEAWSFVAKKQKNVQRHEINAKDDQYVFIAMAGTQRQSSAGASASETWKAPWISCTTCGDALSASRRFQRTAFTPTS